MKEVILGKLPKVYEKSQKKRPMVVKREDEKHLYVYALGTSKPNRDISYICFSNVESIGYKAPKILYLYIEEIIIPKENFRYTSIGYINIML